MKFVIYEYQLPDPVNDICMSQSGRVLAFRFQAGVPTIWVQNDINDTDVHMRSFMLVPTGAPFDEPVLGYVGSDLSARDAFVLHCYELYPQDPSRNRAFLAKHKEPTDGK